MYGRVIPSANIIRGEANTFPVTIGLHQGHALNPYLFTLTIDDITGDIRDEVLECTLFVDDMALIEESRDGINYH